MSENEPQSYQVDSYAHLSPFYNIEAGYGVVKEYNFGSDYNGKITITVLQKGNDKVFHYFSHVTYKEFYTRDQRVFDLARSKTGFYRSYNKMVNKLW